MSNANVFDPTRDRFRVGLGELTGKWGWCLAMGVFLVVLGLIAWRNGRHDNDAFYPGAGLDTARRRCRAGGPLMSDG